MLCLKLITVFLDGFLFMQYQLVFSGEIKEGLNPDDVKEVFARLFSVSERQIKHLFSGETHIIKKNITQEQALKYVVKMDEIGVISYVDIKENELQLPPGITRDRRKGERRFRPDRRTFTRGSIVPDRRKKDRRKNT